MYFQKKYKTEISTEPVEIPHENDILLGRGGFNNKHIGNEQLRQFALERVQTYSQCTTKKNKMNMIRELLMIIRNLDPPGRFLRQQGTKGFWYEAGDKFAREKVSQVYRDAMAALKRRTTTTLPPQDVGEDVHEDVHRDVHEDDKDDGGVENHEQQPQQQQQQQQPQQEYHLDEAHLQQMITPVLHEASFPYPRSIPPSDSVPSAFDPTTSQDILNQFFSCPCPPPLPPSSLQQTGLMDAASSTAYDTTVAHAFSMKEEDATTTSTSKMTADAFYNAWEAYRATTSSSCATESSVSFNRLVMQQQETTPQSTVQTSNVKSRTSYYGRTKKISPPTKLLVHERKNTRCTLPTESSYTTSSFAGTFSELETGLTTTAELLHNHDNDHHDTILQSYNDLHGKQDFPITSDELEEMNLGRDSNDDEEEEDFDLSTTFYEKHDEKILPPTKRFASERKEDYAIGRFFKDDNHMEDDDSTSPSFRQQNNMNHLPSYPLNLDKKYDLTNISSEEISNIFMEDELSLDLKDFNMFM